MKNYQFTGFSYNGSPIARTVAFDCVRCGQQKATIRYNPNTYAHGPTDSWLCAVCLPKVAQRYGPNQFLEGTRQ